MAANREKISGNRKRILDVVDAGSTRLGNAAHKMVVDCGKDNNWINGPARNQGHGEIGSVDQIRNTMDPSALLSVMLRVLRERRDYKGIPGINFVFVDKVRKIRNDATHYDAKLLSDDDRVGEAIRAIIEFNQIIQNAASRPARPAPAAPRTVRPETSSRPAAGPAAPVARQRTGRPVAPPPRSPSRPAATRHAVAARPTVYRRPTRRKTFLLRPQFWAMAAGAVTLVAVDFWGYSGVPESGAIWRAPATMAGIIWALLALFSAGMTGRASGITASLSLALLPVMVLMFVFYQVGAMESDGFAVSLGFIMLLWAAVTVSVPVVSMISALRRR